MQGRRKQPRPRRRWWQHVVRVLVIGVMTLTGLYVSFPFWAPRGLLREYVRADLQKQMGVPIQLDDLDISWSRGVTLRGLKIASEPAFGSLPLAEIDTITSEYAPLDMFLRNRRDWMVIDGLRVHIRTDAAWNSNLAPFVRMPASPRTERVAVRNVVAELHLPQQDRPLLVHVADMQIQEGRSTMLGAVTMSAGLPQASPSAAVGAIASPAPINARFAGTPESAFAAATASLSFSQVDLEQLNLPRILNLKLKKLSGLCSGSVNFQISRQAGIEGMTLNVSIRQLDAQPQDGRRLPVFDEALLRMAATFDLTLGAGEGKVEIQSASIRLPGLDMAGHATVLVDAFEGNWESVKSLELKGVVQPAQIASILGYKPAAGEPVVAGPVGLEISANHQEDHLGLKFLADATPCQVLVGGRPIKPEGRAMKVELTGDLDHNKEELSIASGQVTLGDNHLHFAGKVCDVFRLARRMENRPALSDILAGLSSVNLQGSSEFRDLAAISDIEPRVKSLPWDVKFDGLLQGQWSLLSQDGVRLRASLRAPAGTHLAAGMVEKPPADVLGLEVSAVVDAATTSLRDLDVDVSVEQKDEQNRPRIGRLSINRARVSLQGPDGQAGLACSGRFDADRVELLLGCLRSGDLRGLQVAGGVGGQFDSIADAANWQAQIKLDLGRCSLAAWDYFRKPADEEATANLSLACKQNSFQARAEAALGGAKLKGSGTADLSAMNVEGDLQVDLTDAAWAVNASPLLASRLAGQKFHGPASLQTHGRLKDGVFEASGQLVADDLTYKHEGAVVRGKSAGTPLRASFAAKVSPSGAMMGSVLDLKSLALQLGDSRLDISGSAKLGDMLTSLVASGPSCEYKLDISGSAVVDDAMGRLVPELLPLIRDHGLKGKATLTAGLTGTQDQMDIKLAVDAAQTSIQKLPLTAASQKASQAASQPAGLPGPLSKAAGTPAGMQCELSLQDHFSVAALKNLEIDVGPLRVLADARADLVPGGVHLPDDIVPRSVHASISTRRAGDLAKLLPALSPYDLTGDFFCDMEWRYPIGGRPELASASVTIDRLAGRRWNKEFSLEGELRLSQVSADANGYHFKRIATDGLTFKIGANSGTLVMDVRNVPEKTAGEFSLLSPYLDDMELAKWFSPDAPGSSTTSSAPATTPASNTTLRQPGPGTGPVPGQPRRTRMPSAATVLRAQDVIVGMRRYLEQADLKGNISIDRFRTFDAGAKLTYDCKYLDMDLAVRDKHLTLDYGTSVNGGDYRRRLEVVLGAPNTPVRIHSEIRDLIAGPNIQPQLAKSFPGNTVFGTFSRTEDIGFSLEELVINMLDPQYQPRATGKAITIATDGELVGRAAPKVIATMFPGLNLAKYRYNKMTAFAEMRPDGSSVNDMIFSGQQYDTYIEGTTDSENIGRYEMGLILAGSPQSPELNHEYKLGRLLLVNTTARIEDGKLYDQVVSYPWPNESLGALIIRNNPVYRLWVNSGK